MSKFQKQNSLAKVAHVIVHFDTLYNTKVVVWV